MDVKLNLREIDRAELIGGQPGGIGTTLTLRPRETSEGQLVTSKEYNLRGDQANLRCPSSFEPGIPGRCLPVRSNTAPMVVGKMRMLSVQRLAPVC